MSFCILICFFKFAISNFTKCNKTKKVNRVSFAGTQMVTMEKQSVVMQIGTTSLFSMKMISSILIGALSYLTGIKTTSMYS